MLRAVLTEENLKELLIHGVVVVDTRLQDITLRLEDAALDLGIDQIGITIEGLRTICTGGIHKAQGLNGLVLEYALSDIGYDRIVMILEDYESIESLMKNAKELYRIEGVDTETEGIHAGVELSLKKNTIGEFIHKLKFWKWNW